MESSIIAFFLLLKDAFSPKPAAYLHVTAIEPVRAPATWLLVSLMAIMHASVGGYCRASVGPFVLIVLFMSICPWVSTYVHTYVHVCMYTYMCMCKKGFVAFAL